MSDLQTSHKDRLRGTEFYSCPEILRKEEISTKLDVWSTGCTSIELYTEERVQPSEESMQVIEAILKGSTPSVQNVPHFLQKVVSDFFLNSIAWSDVTFWTF